MSIKKDFLFKDRKGTGYNRISSRHIYYSRSLSAFRWWVGGDRNHMLAGASIKIKRNDWLLADTSFSSQSFRFILSLRMNLEAWFKVEHDSTKKR